MIRKGITSFVKELKGISGVEQVTLTTNGILLKEVMDDLAMTGIDGINLSLGTLNPQVFEKITRRDSFDKVLEGFYTALFAIPAIV